MTPEDNDWFTRPYSDDEIEAPSPLDRLIDRAGVRLPNATILADELFADLDSDMGGIRWWPDPPHKRVLVSDHAYDCVHELQRTFLDAKLHLLETERAWDAETKNMRRWIVQSGGDPSNLPKPEGPGDETHTYLASLHLAGFARALADGLDCLAGAIAALVPLPIPLFTISWPQASNEIAQQAASKRASPRKSVCARIDEATASAGPEGWTTWLASWRNMLVHRPHQTAIAHVDAGERRLLVPSMTPEDRLRVVNHLPKMPDRSTVEVLRDASSPTHCYLSEDARVTTSRLLAAAIDMTDSICARLVEHHRDRREGRIAIDQPLEALWPDRKLRPAFEGFAPNSSPVSGEQMMVHPTQGQRMKAAKLLDADREAFWGGSDSPADPADGPTD